MMVRKVRGGVQLVWCGCGRLAGGSGGGMWRRRCAPSVWSRCVARTEEAKRRRRTSFSSTSTLYAIPMQPIIAMPCRCAAGSVSARAPRPPGCSELGCKKREPARS